MFRRQHTIDNRYNKAIKVALVQIIAILVLSALLLDGGTTFRKVLFAVLVYLATLALIVVRRPNSPATSDLAIVQFGFLALVTLVIGASELYPFFRNWLGPR